MFVEVFHLFVIAVNFYTIWFDQNYVEVPIPEQFRQHTKDLPFKSRVLFLTIWVLVLQTLYFTIALCNDIFGTNEARPKSTPFIRTIKDTLYSLAFPAGVFVTTMYWGLYNIQPELIMPDYLAGVFPDWVNHVMHTTVAVFIIIELLISNITYPSSKLGLTVGVIFILCYVSLLVKVYLTAGTLLYPVLDTISATAGFVIVFFMALYGLSLYFISGKLNSLVSASDGAKNVSKRESRKAI